ncbi:MAG: pilus assembly protein, partial [Pseudobdellovibrionaceae bacterium]
MAGFLLAFFLSVQAHAESLVIKIGEDYKLPLPSNHRVWVQNRKLLSLQTRGGILVLNGNIEGFTTLQV